MAPKSPEMNNNIKTSYVAKNTQLAYDMISKWNTGFDKSQTQKMSDTKIEPVTI